MNSNNQETEPSRREFLRNSMALGALATSTGVFAAGGDTIRVGMIGSGGRCTQAAEQALYADRGARLVAIADIVKARIQESRQALKIKYPDQVAVDDDHCFTGFDAYKHVIESVDVVLIANAAKFHPLHAMAAIQAGKHVFVEKPHAIDPAGVKVIRAAAALAKEKKVSLLSGLQSRYKPGYRECVQRIHDGAIGDVVAIQETWVREAYGVRPDTPGLTEVEYQASHQYRFHWLCGDDVPQTLIHNLDRSRWVMREQSPVKCFGMGGRSSVHGREYGSVFDHHAVVYQFENGVRLYAFCRAADNCYGENSSIILGTKGRAFVVQMRIEGENPWRYNGPNTSADPLTNPYQVEHTEFFKGIRSGNLINSGHYMADSTLTGVMGQLSCYTGKEATWAQASASDFYYAPKPEEVRAGMEPPVKPDADGIYPVYIPGVTKLL
jgi:predicted dehydrogenase